MRKYKIIERDTLKTILDGIATMEGASRIAAEKELRTGVKNKIDTDYGGATNEINRHDPPV